MLMWDDAGVSVKGCATTKRSQGFRRGKSSHVLTQPKDGAKRKVLITGIEPVTTALLEQRSAD